jgi:predicted porin
MTQGMKRVSLALAAALVATPALAIEVKAGNWDLSFTGNVNAFVTFAACGDATDAAFSADSLPLACAKDEDAPNYFTIESGLLPNALVFTAKSRQANVDVSATIGLYPGQNSADGNLTNDDGKGALASPGIDVRQGFLTFGDKSWGTVKVGRDLGIFGGEAILSDMTLLGVGSFGGARGANTTLGHIGTGYQYADWIPQVSYTTPSFSGLTLNVGILQGLNLSGFTRHETPMAQAKVAYDLTGPVAGKIWAGGMVEQAKNAADDDVTAVAGELGVKVNTQGLGVVAYGFYGSGIGTTVLGLSAIGPGDEERTSFGYWGQVTYQIGKLKPGISYGASHLQEADNEEDDTLIKRNATLTAGLYYSLTESLNLVAEYNKTWSENQGGDDITDNVFSLGSIIFF